MDPELQLLIKKLDEPLVSASGSGRAAAQAPEYVEMAAAHVADPDRSAAEHMELLAKINRGV